jgi:hypothetical protein
MMNVKQAYQISLAYNCKARRAQDVERTAVALSLAKYFTGMEKIFFGP